MIPPPPTNITGSGSADNFTLSIAFSTIVFIF
jgi:hypothetical protein